MNELNVCDSTYITSSGVLQGWREHFSKLATPNDTLKKDHAYKQLVKTEMLEIFDICTHMANSPTNIETITVSEVKEAISSLNKNKAADIYGIVAEHILYGCKVLLEFLTRIINQLFTFGKIPESLKLGVLTPVYKRKGSNTEAKNYRGITILPVITKILEAVLRGKIQPIINANQSALQSRAVAAYLNVVRRRKPSSAEGTRGRGHERGIFPPLVRGGGNFKYLPLLCAFLSGFYAFWTRF